MRKQCGQTGSPCAAQPLVVVNSIGVWNLDDGKFSSEGRSILCVTEEVRKSDLDGINMAMTSRRISQLLELVEINVIWAGSPTFMTALSPSRTGSDFQVKTPVDAWATNSSPCW
jgi:hypothetical protein